MPCTLAPLRRRAVPPKENGRVTVAMALLSLSRYQSISDSANSDVVGRRLGRTCVPADDVDKTNLGRVTVAAF